jgi:hypothetical protein
MRAATAAKNNPQNGVHKTTQPSVDTHDSSKVVPHDATAAARTLLLVARDPSTTPESFLVELRAMAGRLGLHS